MAIGDAFRQIRHGYAKRVLCGGTDVLSERVLFAAWNNMGILASEDGVAGGCRPFDAASSGMVLGEAAAMLVLESEASARERGARIYGRVFGYGESSDASHITQPSIGGQLPALCAALESADIQVAELGAVQAHGTGTEPSDSAESQSLARVLGSCAPDIPVVSTKPTTGHTLGASGALESVIALQWLEHGVVTPNISLRERRDGCRLHVPIAPVTLARPLILNCAFAFGGANAALILGGA
jgi:3-oxoacyl-[acyl-carrier-protein] synthase II